MENNFLNQKRERSPSKENEEENIEESPNKIKKIKEMDEMDEREIFGLNEKEEKEEKEEGKEKEKEKLEIEEKQKIEEIEEIDEKDEKEEKEEKGEKEEKEKMIEQVFNFENKENKQNINNNNSPNKQLKEKEEKGEKEEKEKEKEDDESVLVELIFDLYSKTSGPECFICKKDISKNIKFLCEKCNNQVFCIKCLLDKKHPVEHEFQIVDNLNKYPLFTEDWKMSEEYKLLHNLSTAGLNNWEDISNSMGNRGQVECESHYYSFYYTDQKDPNPKEESIILDNNKNIIKEKLEKNNNIEKNKLNEYQINKGNIPEPPKEVKTYKRNGRCLCLRKNMKNGGAESAAEILGCRPKRNEFETEFLNDTEIELSHLEFDPNDKEEDIKIKYDILKDFNLRIKEREERKQFVFDKGLLDLRRQNRLESKLSRDEYELLLFLKPFARFYENSEFFDLFEGIAIEQELKLLLKNLEKLEKEKNNKGEKICSIEEIENYFDIDKSINRTRKKGNLFTNIDEPKNIMNLLGHRVERVLEYEKEIASNNNNKNKIFDDDEHQFVKEMPLAISTFYDIKKRANNLLKKFNDKNAFSNKFSELLGKYDLEEQTKNDILEFYKKKFNDSFIVINNIKNNDLIDGINNKNIDFKNNKNQNDNNLINNNDLLFSENNLISNDELTNNNHNKKINNYPELKLNFNNLLENEISSEK